MSGQVNSRVLLHRGRVFELSRENVTLANGVTIDLDVIRHPGAAAIVPLLNDATVVLIRQYRHAVGGEIWEIPAGTLDRGEDPLHCASRELTEETGFAAGRWQPLGEIVPVPGYSSERIHLFLAAGLRPAEQKLEQDELLRVQEVGFDEALAMIARGDIRDGKTICGLFMARAWLQKNGRF